VASFDVVNSGAVDLGEPMIEGLRIVVFPHQQVGGQTPEIQAPRRPTCPFLTPVACSAQSRVIASMHTTIARISASSWLGCISTP
jgi:hypothetical protein